MTERSRYPGYDVLAKRETPSWDARRAEVIEQRLATPDAPRFFTADEWASRTHCAVASCRRRDDEDPVSLVALLDAKLLADHGDGFREAEHALYARSLATGPCRTRCRGQGAA